MSPATFKDTKCIIDSADPSGNRNNLRTESPFPTFIQKLPYDNAAMPVKQIDASE